jgi:hypothetical protein
MAGLPHRILSAVLTASPTPSATPHAGGSGSHGTAFYVLAAVLIVALLISVWRLRRRTSGPETTK